MKNMCSPALFQVVFRNSLSSSPRPSPPAKKHPWSHNADPLPPTAGSGSSLAVFMIRTPFNTFSSGTVSARMGDHPV